MPARSGTPAPSTHAQLDVGYTTLAPPAQDSPIQVRGKNRLVGTWMPAEDVVFGIGIYRVQRDRHNNSLRDTYGKTRGVAAVGFSLSF